MHSFSGLIWTRLRSYKDRWHLALVCEELTSDAVAKIIIIETRTRCSVGARREKDCIKEVCRMFHKFCNI